MVRCTAEPCDWSLCHNFSYIRTTDSIPHEIKMLLIVKQLLLKVLLKVRFLPSFLLFCKLKYLLFK